MMVLHLMDLDGEPYGHVSGLELDYEAEKRVWESSEEHAFLGCWELIDSLGVRCIWERQENRVVIVERAERFVGGKWGQAEERRFKEPWSWSYKHPNMPEWRCRAPDLEAASKMFHGIWKAQARKGRMKDIKGAFHDGVVYKRELGKRKSRARGLPDEAAD